MPYRVNRSPGGRPPRDPSGRRPEPSDPQLGRDAFVRGPSQDPIREEAERSGQFYINRRWLGGTLTNFVTIKNRLRVMKNLQNERDRGEWNYLPKQEGATKELQLGKLERTLGWRPRETFASGLAQTVEWYLTHEAWWRRVLDGSYRLERLGL